MPTNHELTRIARAYSAYQRSEETQARWSQANPGNRAILAERQRMLVRVLDGHPLHKLRILEVGCGVGSVLANLAGFDAQLHNLYGIDLLSERVCYAHQRYPNIAFQVANAEQLPFANASFDLVLVFTVFSSILDQDMARNVATAIDRVLRPDGAVVWYDFRYNNPRNPQVRGMPRSAIQALFPSFRLELQTLTLLPPLARRLGHTTPILYPLLAQLPFLRTHYLGLLIRDTTRG